jgi:hypothetical protein
VKNHVCDPTVTRPLLCTGPLSDLDNLAANCLRSLQLHVVGPHRETCAKTRYLVQTDIHGPVESTTIGLLHCWVISGSSVSHRAVLSSHPFSQCSVPVACGLTPLAATICDDRVVGERRADKRILETVTLRLCTLCHYVHVSWSSPPLVLPCVSIFRTALRSQSTAELPAMIDSSTICVLLCA